MVVELDTVTDDLFGIVGTAADGGTLVDAPHQLVARHLDGYHTVDLALQLPEEELQRLRLRDGARESIDDAALRTVRLCGCIAVRTRVPGYKTHASLDAFCEKFSERVGERFLVYTKDLRKDGATTLLPVMMTMMV